MNISVVTVTVACAISSQSAVQGQGSPAMQNTSAAPTASAAGQQTVKKSGKNRAARQPNQNGGKGQTSAVGRERPRTGGSTAPGAGRPHPNTTPALSFAQAMRRRVHERHDRAWWTRRYTTIVFVTGGYYYYDAGYWFPAWGYDPAYDNYDYDGPIYTYGNLLPDQVIFNVQRALKQLGYYTGPLTGSLSPSSRAALAAFQDDSGLDATGAIDGPTVEALGLY